jgi:hypothetical protein
MGAAAPLALTALVLASCGGSSSSTSTSATQASAAKAPPGIATTTSPATTSPATTTPKRSSGPESLRKGVLALRECLARNGVNLPKPGSGKIGALPPGVSKAQYQAAIRKCAPTASLPSTPGSVGGTKGARPGRFQKALESFAACMRAHGIKLPAPNPHGTGPIFETKGINTRSAAFRAATAACRSTLRSALPTQPGSR